MRSNHTDDGEQLGPVNGVRQSYQLTLVLLHDLGSLGRIHSLGTFNDQRSLTDLEDLQGNTFF